MAFCEICGERIIGKENVIIAIGAVYVCDSCKHKFEQLSNGQLRIKDFLTSKTLPKIADKIHEEFEQKEQALIQKEKQLIEESNRQKYSKTELGLYEYDVITVLNKNHGMVNKEKMLEILNRKAKEGWKLHTMYSNELGKNALMVLGFGVNETACEDVMVFERKLKDNDL